MEKTDNKNTKQVISENEKGAKNLLNSKSIKNKNVIEYNDFLPIIGDNNILVKDQTSDSYSSKKREKLAKETIFPSKLIHIKNELEFNHLHLPDVLVEIFSASKVHVSLTKQDSNWIINKIHSKNAYFRAYFYHKILEILENNRLLLEIERSDIKKIDLTLNFLKKSSLDEEIGIYKNIIIEDNHIFFDFQYIQKPKKYEIIQGGLNVIALGEQLKEAVFPKEYENLPEIIELKKSKAFLTDLYNVKIK
ncbi:hypothetical protein QEJ31_01820 [Pigmentibacter sp. JX0631]|uniref:hypothetical protein n=1 Tax=Pigmentibacter sp. JX0631 TaxID=2976982 RepID=UPI00246938A3|nr:hypothetical protein [Pigmentibacter sp. JX0631]WGL60340.1 hypothetical protein QEJ31_01820 [Pigmentibacter sp. JX0631]